MEEQIVTLDNMPAQETEPKATKKKKRLTLSSLKADFSSLESFMDEEIIPAIELIESRINEIIEKGGQTPIVETPMLETRLQALEAAEKITSGNQSTLLKTHIQMQDDLNITTENIDAIHAAVMELQEAETADAPTPHPMSDNMIPFHNRENDIKHLANLAVSMSDVLLICRFLKEDPEIPEETRIETLHLACQRAGVPVSAGMTARAGVKYVVA